MIHSKARVGQELRELTDTHSELPPFQRTGNDRFHVS
jgi:hypothetical protein